MKMLRHLQQKKPADFSELHIFQSYRQLISNQPISNHQLAILLKCTNQVVGDHLCRAAFNLVTLNHVYQLSVFK